MAARGSMALEWAVSGAYNVGVFELVSPQPAVQYARSRPAIVSGPPRYPIYEEEYLGFWIILYILMLFGGRDPKIKNPTVHYTGCLRNRTVGWPRKRKRTIEWKISGNLRKSQGK